MPARARARYQDFHRLVVVLFLQDSYTARSNNRDLTGFISRRIDVPREYVRRRARDACIYIYFE